MKKDLLAPGGGLLVPARSHAAEIMDLPMEVVEKPEEMRPALDRLGDVDLVLIDTAGRSPKSDARIDQLVELLRGRGIAARARPACLRFTT